jgi:hypothetical protein
MRRQAGGPRRSQSVDALRRRTRLLALVALLALVGGIVSDVVGGSFWTRHALLAGLTASVIIVMLSVAVINEVLDRRRRERWSVLAQFVMLELVRNARLIWTGVLAQVGLLTPDAVLPESVEASGGIVRDTSRLAAAVREAIADNAARRGLQDEIALLAAHSDEVLGRWAGVMLNADIYAEVIDRHVELVSDLSWLMGQLDNSDPPADHRRQRRAHSSPAVQVEGQVAGEELTNRIVVITQLAEELDRATLALALRIVPVAWWEARLGTTILPERRPAAGPSSHMRASRSPRKGADQRPGP